jgi:hypothetical protein
MNHPLTRRRFFFYAGAAALIMSTNRLLSSPAFGQATTIASNVTQSSFTIESPDFGRVNAFNLGHGQFTGTRARFNEGLQWWQSDNRWHYMVARNPKLVGGDGYWVTLPGSEFTFRDNTPYRISFDLDFEQEILHSFQIAEAGRVITSLDLSSIPMYAWEWHDPPSIEPQIQLYANSGLQYAELLVKHVVLTNSKGSIFYEDVFDRVRWEFGMAMKNGMVKAEANGMRIYAPPNGGIDVFRRLNAAS